MRFLLLAIILILISCDLSNKKSKIKSQAMVISKDVDTLKIPNIFVVKTIFYSKDSLPISGDIYEVNNKKPIMLLCHQAGYSRGEYKDIARKLCNYGFSSMAIDQRSGGKVNGVLNQTTVAAKTRNLPTDYLDARQDIEAAINYLYEMNGGQKIILVGSSYSATLALLVGSTSDKVKAVAAFSPGEYFKTINVQNSIKDISKLVFVTSSKNEAEALEELVSSIDNENLTHFIPANDGIHGAKVLWNSTDGNEEYWNAFLKFLLKTKSN
jgi:predicted alpha/beta-fold hydrolase